MPCKPLLTLPLHSGSRAPRSRTEEWVLCTPITHKNPQLIHLLLSKGHDINHLEGGGGYSKTALHVAVFYEDYPLIMLFLENSALDLNKLDSYGDTALHIAIVKGNLEVVKLLHAAGADLEITDKLGKTALLLALHRWNVEIVEFLIKNGANVNARCLAKTRLDVTLLHGI